MKWILTLSGKILCVNHDLYAKNILGTIECDCVLFLIK